MTKNQVQSILTFADIDANSWVKIKNIKSFDFGNDGNQVIYDSAYYYFNMNYELLFVKEYYYAYNYELQTWELKPMSENTFDVCLSFEGITSVTFGAPYADTKDIIRQEVY